MSRFQHEYDERANETPSHEGPPEPTPVRTAADIRKDQQMTTQETTERAYPTTNERIEIEDDLRCGECGSTEAGNCFYCKAD